MRLILWLQAAPEISLRAYRDLRQDARKYLRCGITVPSVIVTTYCDGVYARRGEEGEVLSDEPLDATAC